MRANHPGGQNHFWTFIGRLISFWPWLLANPLPYLARSAEKGARDKIEPPRPSNWVTRLRQGFFARVARSLITLTAPIMVDKLLLEIRTVGERKSNHFLIDTAFYCFGA